MGVFYSSKLGRAVVYAPCPLNGVRPHKTEPEKGSEKTPQPFKNCKHWALDCRGQRSAERTVLTQKHRPCKGRWSMHAHTQTILKRNKQEQGREGKDLSLSLSLWLSLIYTGTQKHAHMLPQSGFVLNQQKFEEVDKTCCTAELSEKKKEEKNAERTRVAAGKHSSNAATAGLSWRNQASTKSPTHCVRLTLFTAQARAAPTNQVHRMHKDARSVSFRAVFLFLPPPSKTRSAAFFQNSYWS